LTTRQDERRATPATPYRDLPIMDGVRHSWGAWGERDTLGCLNRLENSSALGALRSVRRGAVFPLSLEMHLPGPPLFGRPAFGHDLVYAADGTSLNDVISDWNTQVSSQWDGFAHVAWPGHGHYGGHELHGVQHWAERGIVGRSILADVGRWRAETGRPLNFTRPDAITASDLRSTLSAQCTNVRAGDILLVRTGWVAWYLQTGNETRAAIADRAALVSPGLSAAESVAELLWDFQLAAVAGDNPALEVWPFGCDETAGTDPAATAPWPRKHEINLHTRLLPGLGMPVGELWDLERLAADCAADLEYAGMLVATPINLRGAAASPANALVLK
jgi:kynurenine formamidase